MALRDLFRLRSALVSSMCVVVGVYGCSGETEDDKPGPGTADADSGAGIDSDAASGNGDGDGSVDPDGGTDAAQPDVVTCPDTIVTGSNTLTIGSTKRTFLVDLPSDTSKPAALVFSWHGFGDTAQNFRSVVNWNPNQDPAIPAIVVTPDDSGLPPPAGLDWDIGKATPEDKNVDVQFFDAMLGCFKKSQSIDETRIYSFGFSAGAVVTNMLHSRYPKLFAAIVTASGAWMNDKAETDLIKIKIDWKWPALDPADQGNVLMTHGGPNDVTVLNLLDLEKSAQAAIPFLKTGQRVVVDCAHDKGHALHPEVNAALMSKYLFAHRLGEPSPFGADGGAFEGYPASCTLRLP